MDEQTNAVKTAILNHPTMAGLSVDEVKKALTRILPLLKMSAQMTENPYDDLAVEFLEKLLTVIN